MSKRPKLFLVKITTSHPQGSGSGYMPRETFSGAVTRGRAARLDEQTARKIARSMSRLDFVTSARVVPA